MLTGAQRFHLASCRRQLVIFTRLGVLSDAATAALAVVDELERGLPPDPEVSRPARVIVFTGHRIDEPGRKLPRFPREAEGEARRMIREAVVAERSKADGEVVGIAGGASGGDILFHEVCAEQGIKTQLFIVGSRDAYVTGVGAGWRPQVGGAIRSSARHPSGPGTGQLAGHAGLPRWLRPAKNYSIWKRHNRWILNNALVHGANRVTLIALRNKDIQPDGTGGTQDMVTAAESRGAKIVLLDAAPLAKIAPAP